MRETGDAMARERWVWKMSRGATEMDERINLGKHGSETPE
jgi:hypothetical protein